jgi:hypothetical protein
LNRHTLVRNDIDFVSSLNIGIIESRNLLNNSSFGSPSWIKNNEETMAANLPSDSFPFFKPVMNCSVKLSLLEMHEEWLILRDRIYSYRLATWSGRYFWENKTCNVRKAFSRVFKLKKKVLVEKFDRKTLLTLYFEVLQSLNQVFLQDYPMMK